MRQGCLRPWQGREGCKKEMRDAGMEVKKEGQEDPERDQEEFVQGKRVLIDAVFYKKELIDYVEGLGERRFGRGRECR